MKILENAVTDYFSANFTEDEAVWSSDAIYNYKDEARDGHFIYKYAGADGTNTTVTPGEDYATNLSSKTNKWVRARPTNYWAALDGETATQTENKDTIEIAISSKNYDTIALLGVEAKSVTIELTDNDTGEIVYTKNIDLQDESVVIDEMSYWFADFVFIPTVYRDDIPMFTNSMLSIVIDNTGSIAKVGRLVFGRSTYIGLLQYGSSLDSEKYSVEKFDAFGIPKFIHRKAANIDAHKVRIPTGKVPMIRRLLKSYDAIPILFIADESKDSNVEHFANFGFHQRFNILWKNGTYSIVSLTIKSLI